LPWAPGQARISTTFALEDGVSDRWKKGLLAAGWTLRTAVELAIQVEEMGQHLYRALARRWESDPTLRALFTQLASEEATHRAGLRVLLAKVGTKRTEDDLAGEDLQAIAHVAFFSTATGALGGIETLATPRQVLEAVLGFENSTVLYYRALRDVLGPSATIDTLIAEEKRHTASALRAIQELARREQLGTSGHEAGQGSAAT
jgi:rubrerythrin